MLPIRAFIISLTCMTGLLSLTANAKRVGPYGWRHDRLAESERDHLGSEFPGFVAQRCESRRPVLARHGAPSLMKKTTGR